MKTLLTVIGLVLIIGCIYFVYNDYEAKQTITAKIEKEVSNALKYITRDNDSDVGNLNKDADTTMIGGGVASLLGVILFVSGMRE